MNNILINRDTLYIWCKCAKRSKRSVRRNWLSPYFLYVSYL